MLENLNHRVSTVTNGQEALDILQKQDFDLILMDINLPVLDGIEATKAIRQFTNEGKAKTPIIAITAGSEVNSPHWLKAGINSYILKPVSLDTLNISINTLFENLSP